MPPQNQKTLSGLTRFKELHSRFIKGLKWINDGYVKRGWTHNNRTIDPSFETDIKIFKDEVVRPMDEAYRLLTANEKRDC
jgi:hypothetical protein